VRRQCQPSAKSAIDPNAMPEVISTTIMEEVSASTQSKRLKSSATYARPMGGFWIRCVLRRKSRRI